MSASTNPPKRENTYIINTENGIEMARLLDQDRLLTKGIGGLFSGLTASEVTRISRILDIGCGPGGWAQEVVFAYPNKEVIGFDISQSMVEYAQAQARVQGLQAVSFYVMDALEPLDFPDEHFDLVNARLISGFMVPAAWPALMQECLRVLRPGGTLRLTEVEMPFTNSLTHETIWRWLYRALKQTGQSCSPSGELLGIIPLLSSFLQQAGFQGIRQIPYVIDYSIGTVFHNSFQLDFWSFCKLLKPFLIKTGVTTPEQFDQVFEQMQVEMQANTFRALRLFLTVVGTKPLSHENSRYG